MKFKAVIFDLDGTLLNTLQDLADATNDALKHYGFPPHPTDAYKYYIGEGREKLADLALPVDQRNPENIQKVVKMIDRLYSANWAVNSRPYDGILELLDGLTAQKIKKAVLSNKSHYFTDTMVKVLLSKWSFDIVLGVSDVTPKKPDPTGALHIIKDLRIAPEETIYLGDTDIDMKTAVAAGMYPVGALWGFRTPDELKAGGAKLLIKHPQEMLGLFK